MAALLGLWRRVLFTLPSLLTLLLFIKHSRAQGNQSCIPSSADAASVNTLAALSASDLLAGALSSSTQSLWDFSIQPRKQSIWEPQAGQHVEIQCVGAFEVELAPPTLEALILPKALASRLTNGSLLLLTSSTLHVSCEAVLSLQRFLCNSTFIYGSRIQIAFGAVVVGNWTYGNVQMRDVLVTCHTATHSELASSQAILPLRNISMGSMLLDEGAPLPPCTIHDVYDGQQLNAYCDGSYPTPVQASNATNALNSHTVLDLEGASSTAAVLGPQHMDRRLTGLPRLLVLQRSITLVPPTASKLNHSFTNTFSGFLGVSAPQLPVFTNVTLLSAGGSDVRFTLDLAQLAGAYQIDEGHTFTLRRVILMGLAKTFLSPHLPTAMFSPLTMHVAFFLRPGIPKTQVLFIHDSTLFLDGGELAYLKYFLTLLLSPVPEYQAKASWLGMSQVQIEGPSGSTPVDQGSAYNSSATATTASSDLTIGYMKQPSTIAERIKLVNELPGYAPLSEKYSGLRRVLALRVPLTACRPVGNETEVILALNVTSKTPDDTGTTYQFFWSPFTQLGTANGPWPEDGVQFTTHAIMMCAGASACLAPGDPRPGVEDPKRIGYNVISLNHRPSLFRIAPGKTLRFSSLTFGNLPTRRRGYHSDRPLEVMSSLMWAVAGANDPRVSLILHNCTLLVPYDELVVLQRALAAEACARAGADPRVSPTSMQLQAWSAGQADAHRAGAAVSNSFVASVAAYFGPSVHTEACAVGLLRLERASTERFSGTHITYIGIAPNLNDSSYSSSSNDAAPSFFKSYDSHANVTGGASCYAWLFGRVPQYIPHAPSLSSLGVPTDSSKRGRKGKLLAWQIALIATSTFLLAGFLAWGVLLLLVRGRPGARGLLHLHRASNRTTKPRRGMEPFAGDAEGQVYDEPGAACCSFGAGLRRREAAGTPNDAQHQHQHHMHGANHAHVYVPVCAQQHPGLALGRYTAATAAAGIADDSAQCAFIESEPRPRTPPRHTPPLAADSGESGDSCELPMPLSPRLHRASALWPAAPTIRTSSLMPPQPAVTHGWRGYGSAGPGTSFCVSPIPEAADEEVSDSAATNVLSAAAAHVIAANDPGFAADGTYIDMPHPRPCPKQYTERQHESVQHPPSHPSFAAQAFIRGADSFKHSLSVACDVSPFSFPAHMPAAVTLGADGSNNGRRSRRRGLGSGLLTSRSPARLAPGLQLEFRATSLPQPITHHTYENINTMDNEQHPGAIGRPHLPSGAVSPQRHGVLRLPSQPSARSHPSQPSASTSSGSSTDSFDAPPDGSCNWHASILMPPPPTGAGRGRGRTDPWVAMQSAPRLWPESVLASGLSPRPCAPGAPSPASGLTHGSVHTASSVSPGSSMQYTMADATRVHNHSALPPLWQGRSINRNVLAGGHAARLGFPASHGSNGRRSSGFMPTRPWLTAATAAAAASAAPGAHSTMPLTLPVGGTARPAESGQVQVEDLARTISNLGQDIRDRQVTVTSVLGQGASGIVYKGVWQGLQVAVKAMYFNSDLSRPGCRQARALLEAAISSNLTHTHIVSTYAYELKPVANPHGLQLHGMGTLAAGQEGWRLHLIQEYCDGGDLRSAIDGGFFSPAHSSGAAHPPVLPGVSSAASVPAWMAEEHPLWPHMAPDKRLSPFAALAAAGQRSTAPADDLSGSQGEGVHRSDCVNAGHERPSSSAKPQGQLQTDDVMCRGSAVTHGSISTSAGSAACQADVAGASVATEVQTILRDVPPQPQPPPQPAPRRSLPMQPLLQPFVPRVCGDMRLCLEAAMQVACGMAHIHAKHIVHGDLTPSNILLVRAPCKRPLTAVCKVADFGLSLRMDDTQTHASNLFQGTPYYVAPEVVLSGKLSKHADVYAFGIILWEMHYACKAPWRQPDMRERLVACGCSYPLLNTALLGWHTDCPRAYADLARACFQGCKEQRPSFPSITTRLQQVAAALPAGTSLA